MNVDKRSKNSTGFSLVEALVVAGITAIVALVLAQIVVDERKSLTLAHMRSQLDLTASYLGKTIADPTALGKSATATPVEPNFAKCILNTGPCNLVGATGIDFYDAVGSHVAGIGTGPVDGVTPVTDANTPVKSPIYYDSSLAKCTPAVATGTPNCGIQVITYYTTTCSPAPCATPNSMTIFYVIKQAAGVSLTGTTTFMKPIINQTVIALPIQLMGTKYNMTSWANGSQLGGSPLWTTVTTAGPNGQMSLNVAPNPALTLLVSGNETLIANATSGEAGVLTANGVSILGTLTTVNINATGFIQAGTTITSGGNMTSGGSLSAATTVGAGTAITAGTTIFAGGNISTTNGNIVTTNGSMTAGGSLTLGGGANMAGNLGVGSNITAGGTITAASDLRLKKDIVPIQDALAKILDLHGVYFQWKDKKRGSGQQMGLIAQDVEKVFPELVLNDQNGTKSVAYGNLAAGLVEAIREQEKQIEKLQETNLRQADELQKLSKDFEELKHDLASKRATAGGKK